MPFKAGAGAVATAAAAAAAAAPAAAEAALAAELHSCFSVTPTAPYLAASMGLRPSLAGACATAAAAAAAAAAVSVAALASVAAAAGAAGKSTGSASRPRICVLQASPGCRVLVLPLPLLPSAWGAPANGDLVGTPIIETNGKSDEDCKW